MTTLYIRAATNNVKPWLCQSRYANQPFYHYIRLQVYCYISSCKLIWL